MEKLLISSEEAFRVQRKMMIGKARKHLSLALHWVDRMRKEERRISLRTAELESVASVARKEPNGRRPSELLVAAAGRSQISSSHSGLQQNMKGKAET